MRLLSAVLAAALLTLGAAGCATRYPADATNPPTNTFGPHAGTPDIAPANAVIPPQKTGS